MSNVVRVSANQVRGYWLTDVGQRVTGWVTAGEYEAGAAVGGVVALVGRDGWAWHVAERDAAALPPALGVREGLRHPEAMPTAVLWEEHAAGDVVLCWPA